MKLIILGIISTLCLIFIPYWAGLLFMGTAALQTIQIWILGLVIALIIALFIILARLVYLGICARKIRKW